MPASTRFIRPAAPPGRATRNAAVAAAACVAGIAAGAGPAQAAFPGANGRIAFSSDRASVSDVWSMNPCGGGLVNLTPDTSSDEGLPNWSADGRTIVYHSDGNALGTNPTPAGFDSPDFELFTMNADGSEVRQITFNELDDEDPAWSPDGRRVVFQRELDPVRGQSDYDVFTMRVSDGGERRLTHYPGRDSAPNWSPDGRRIVFDSQSGDPEAEPEIYTMKTDGSRVRRLTDNTTFDGQPNWSPNGRRLSFQSYREGRLAIYRRRADGRHQKPVTSAVPDAFGSAWSPDGRFIAYTSFADPEIFTVELHGGAERDLTDEPTAADVLPDWQPLPRRGH